MSKDEIFEKLKEIFKIIMGDKIDTNQITLETKVYDRFGLSSVAFIYLVFALEKEFNINLSKVTYTTFDTVQDIVDLIYIKIH